MRLLSIFKPLLAKVTSELVSVLFCFRLFLLKIEIIPSCHSVVKTSDGKDFFDLLGVNNALHVQMYTCLPLSENANSGLFPCKISLLFLVSCIVCNPWLAHVCPSC